MVVIADARDARSLSTKFRKRRDRLLRSFIETERKAVSGPFRILDLGGTADYWKRVGFDWMEANDIVVICVNHLDSEFGEVERKASPRLTYIVGDACAMTDHADGSFDLVHSNSVVEHVGGWDRMRAFADEVRRLARSYYVQTPYFWFPIEPHFFRAPMIHWMPMSWRIKIAQRIGIGHSGRAKTLNDAMRILSSNILLDRLRFRALFSDAEHRFEWLGLPKSMIAMRGSEH